MKIIYAVLVVLFCAVSVAAQITDDALMVIPFDTPDGARGVASYMLTDQKPRSGFLPMRVRSGAEDRVTYAAYFEASIYDFPTLSDVPSGALPPTSFNNGVCAGGLQEYEAFELATFALAMSGYNALDPVQKPHAYGPFATPRGTYLLVVPRLIQICHL